MEPLRLTPKLVPKPWGGRRFAALGRDLPPDGTFGESWELADLAPSATFLEEPWTVVRDGEHAGRTLAELISTERDELLGDVAPTAEGRFPLLVKLLDAREHLSVQVHPPTSWLTTNPGHLEKTESWVVLEAEAGAAIYLGLRPDTTREHFAAAIGTAAIISLLQRVPVAAGDAFHIPSGVVHALGAGVLVAEVQTPSDSTFRLHDWTDEYDRAPRELHVADGLACALAAWDANVAPSVALPGDGSLVRTEDYLLDRHRASEQRLLPLTDTSPHLLLVTTGRVHVGKHDLASGDSLLVPASCLTVPRLDADTVVLQMTPAT